jgi:NAD(P)-dependent dehydrogenase (short-subunit alcohol dehydrogenase family)
MALFGTRALVTGGGRGIGRSISLALAEAGADVALSYRANPDAAEATAAAIRDLGRRAFALRAEMGDPAQVLGLVEESVAALGGLDIVVGNAGMHHRTPFLEMSLEEWGEVLDADLRAPFVLGQAVARQMIAQGQGGRIILISSISADVAFPNLVHYQAAKAGVRMLGRGMALELAPHRITVNMVAPGVTATDLTADTLNNPETRAIRVGKIPLGRPGDPADIAAAVAFIASDATDWMTGSTITVDGGQTLW